MVHCRTVIVAAEAACLPGEGCLAVVTGCDFVCDQIPQSAQAASAPGPGAADSLRGRGPWEPQAVYVGPVALWFIPKPPRPRLSIRRAGLGWLVLLPVMTATLLWVHTESPSLWPFNQRVVHLSQVLLRYEIMAAVCWTYLVGVSVPAWLRNRRLARRDVLAIDEAIRLERWETAGLLLHRYCLLVSAIWHKLPARVAAWDGVLRNRLSRHRRVYIYHKGRPPELPQDATSGFAIAVFHPPRPSPWSAAILLPMAGILYLVLMDIARRGNVLQAFLVNIVLLGILLVSYTTYFATALLGRSSYYRFAPGIMQVVRHRTLRHRLLIESYDLRRLHMVLDLSSLWPGLTLLDTPRYRRETYRLPRTAEAIEAFLRAALSTVPSPPLPEDQLVD